MRIGLQLVEVTGKQKKSSSFSTKMTELHKKSRLLHIYIQQTGLHFNLWSRGGQQRQQAQHHQNRQQAGEDLGKQLFIHRLPPEVDQFLGPRLRAR